MYKLQRFLVVGVLTAVMGGGVIATTKQPVAAQAATTKAKKVSKKSERKYYTASQWSQVTKYRQQAKRIGTTTKGMYAKRPSVKKAFRPGKLSVSYTKRTVNWINFYRTMFGLNKVFANSSWNTSAQMGAATLAAADKGLSHGLVGFRRPSIVSKKNWKSGADATNQSNIYQGANSPYDIVTGYLSDDANGSGLEPGHRMWILGGIKQVGVGQVAGYNDLRVFADNDYDASTPVKMVAFPRAGLTPYALVSHGAPWSISYPEDFAGGSDATVSVSVYDKTAKKKIPVSHITETDSSFGFFGTNVFFLPKKSLIKVNHAYQVKVSGVKEQADISYQTRLFDLKTKGVFY